MDAQAQDARTLTTLYTGGSVAHLVQTILEEAVIREASDVHIDPHATFLQVTYRVDGLLVEAHLLPLTVHLELIARIKILSGLRTDEHRAAQDGRFEFVSSPSSTMDVRVSIVPTYRGENVVMRILRPRLQETGLAELGMSEVAAQLVEQVLFRSQGMILVTGPTGSGKTTTLYALMRMLCTLPLSLVTIEDPIEYSLSGVTQIQTNVRTGLTFAHGLRSILRQDPDVLMVGEIRDTETARIAVNSALTGHLILSTLHTNDAVSTLPRLMDMEVEPYLIAATVRLVIAQRLVRRVCNECCAPRDIEEHECVALRSHVGTLQALPEVQWCGTGCAACFGTGYRGRIGIFELLPVTSHVQQIIANRRLDLLEPAELTSESLGHDGLRKVSEGKTTVMELLRTRHE